jgi:hypothetical protein
MSTIPALRRETSALWSLHHTLGYGLRKFQGRVGQSEPSLQHLASATSQEILGTIKKRTSQPAELKPPNAAWPNWRSRRLKGRACQQSPSSDSVAIVAEKELGSAPSVGASHEWPRGTLKPHLSDESTSLNEEESALSETDGDLCSSSGSNGTHDNSSIAGACKSGRPGRRQKAKRRQLEWEAASRQALVETVHAADSGAAGQGCDWAHEALVTVFENLVEDEFDILGEDSYSYSVPVMGETGMDREQNLHGRQKV